MDNNLHILDSSAWLEILENGPNTPHFRPILEQLPSLLVPAIIITEVRKVVLTQRTREEADAVTRSLSSARVIPIDTAIATTAADLFSQHKLPLADSLIYAITLAPICFTSIRRNEIGKKATTTFRTTAKAKVADDTAARSSSPALKPTATPSKPSPTAHSDLPPRLPSRRR